jgi:tripartite-type tricarboxylate transporter receptor subunit TctC
LDLHLEQQKEKRMPGSHFKRLAALIVCTAASLTAVAQSTYPVKPIRFIAPFPSGGTSDVLSRLLAAKMTEGLGQTVVVENRPGASGNIGHEIAAKAPADGYTIIMSNNGIYTINPYLFKKLPYDPEKDFQPISLVAMATQVLVAHPSVPVNSVKDLIALAKSKPGQINYGSGGRGIISHISGEMFKTVTGTDLTHVPYKGTGQAVADLVAGQLHVIFSDMVPAMPHIKSGRLRALAVTSATRSNVLPDIPTMAEAGAGGFTADTWWAVVVPRGASAEVVTRLNTELARVMKLPEIQERYFSLGVSTAHSAPERIYELAKAERPAIAAVLKKAGIEPE